MNQLYSFLNNRRAKDGEPRNLLSMKPEHRGKYYVTRDDKSRFYNIYNNAICNGELFSILEVPGPENDYIPFIVDVDLKIKDDDPDKTSFLYDNSHVKDVIRIITIVLEEIIEEDDKINENTFNCYVMERAPYKTPKNETKNGYHLHFPFILLAKSDIALHIYPRIVDKMKEQKIPLPSGCSKYEDYIDKNIYGKKGKPWFLYGSTKPECPDPYKVTTCIAYDTLEETFQEDSMNWMKTLVSNYKLEYSEIPTSSDDDGLVEYQRCLPEVFSILFDDIDIDNKIDYIFTVKPITMSDSSFNEYQQLLEEDQHTYESTSSSSSVQNIYGNLKEDFPIEFYQELLNLLPYKFAEERDLWINIGWILYNIFHGSQDGFSLWDEFSKKCPSKYDYYSLQRTWNKMEKREVSLGSLRYLVHQHAPLEYKELCKKFCNDYIEDLTTSSSHHDIAKLIFFEYGDVFRCGSIGRNIWYHYYDHVWNASDQGITLKQKISTVIVNKYQKCKLKLIGAEKDKIKGDIEAHEKRIGWLNKRINSTIEGFEFEKSSSKKTGLQKEIDSSRAEIEKLESSINTLRAKLEGSDKQIDLFSDENSSKKSKSQIQCALLDKTINNLKSSPFKRNVMTECNEIFYEKNFEEKLDKNPLIVAFQNGVYDFKNNLFRDGLPCDYLSKKLPINYNSSYTMDSPEIHEIKRLFETLFPNAELRRYFLSINSQLFLGKVQKMFQIWKGTGDNGKSLLEKLFEKLLGDMCAKLPTALITGKRTQSGAASPELFILNGARLAFLQECTGDEQMNTGLLKELTGGDSLYVRGLNRDPINIHPQFQLIVACNNPPKMSGSALDIAVWRRIRIIDFESYFPSEPSKVPPTEEEQMEQKIFPRDETLSDRIDDLLEPMAWYLLECYKDPFYKNVPEPNIVLDSTNVYKSSNDIIQTWIDERIIESTGNRITLKDMYDDFKDWFHRYVENEKKISKQQFQKFIEAKWGNAKKPHIDFEDKAFKNEDQQQ